MKESQLHPGRIVLEVQTKQCTPAQKKADDLHVQEVINAQATAIQQAHAQVSKMETAMEAGQVIQDTAKAKPVRLRQVPASSRSTNTPIQPCIEDTHQRIGPPVAMEARQAIQVTAKVKLSTSVPSLTSRATTTINSNANLAYQGKMPVPTHNVDEEELEDQLAFPVKVVGHDKFKVVTSMANDVESNNEFSQLIFKEVQASSKHKHLDCDDADYVTSYEVEDFDDEYFDIEDYNLNSCMLPAKELCVMMTNNGVDKPKKSKVNRDVDQEPQQTSTTEVGKLWTKAIIPTLLVWAGSLADPWTISDDELIWSLQIIILTIAPDFEDLNDICPGMAIFNTWHSNFGSIAITLITHFLVSDPEIGMLSLAQAQELCSKLLEGFTFLYVDQDSHKPENIFQSYFILFLLGHMHL
ncbi:hypothetical protein F5J12DRAFT_892293 [Pisolithus orientalis]|uniref:uncharacterized protein n=1 Tax=Pisolithus orientalis TaxID=936130 RepID=UPI0022252B3E|nr:uncharacterized protein F5J12DRAFT_892293 [Pisolithus orientalis]KAI6008313.1 hypothetical protein F5J12DRAFT_892293 [Pisolithus orientalis]